MSLTATIADLIREQGRTRANAIREQADLRARQRAAAGQGLGQAVAGIGQTIANLPVQHRQQQVQQQELAMRNQEMQLRQMQIEQAKQAQATQAQANQAFAQFPRNLDGTFDTPSILQKLAALNAPLDAQEHFAKTLEGLNGVMASANKTRTDHLADVANTLLSLQDKNVPIDADTVHLGLAAAKSAGIATDADEQRIVQLLSSNTDPAQVLRTMRNMGSQYKPEYKTAAPGSTIYEAKTGTPVATMANSTKTRAELAADARNPNSPTAQQSADALELLSQTAPKSATVGSFEDYVVKKYGPNPTPQQIVQAHRDLDKPTQIHVGMAGSGGGLDADAIESAAARFRILGAPSIPTRIEGSDRVKIMNAAAKQEKALGQSPVQSIQRMAAFKADAASLTKMRTMSAAAESFENKALTQAEIVADLSKKVGRTQIPLLNSAILSGKKSILGDTNTQLLYNAITTFTSEYAKIMEGSTGSVSASSDSARKAAAELISPALNKGTLQATLDLMKREMRLTIKGYDETIAHISERMGGSAVQPSTESSSGPRIGERRMINGQIGEWDGKGWKAVK